MVTLAVMAEGPAAWERWRQAFATAAPELRVVSWFDPDFEASGADYAFVWDPPPGEMARLRHMRAILCSGAGINHLVHRNDFPASVPLVRMGGDQTAALMADYVLWAAIGLLRDGRTWALQQEQKIWRRNLEFRTCAGTRIGILGFGHLGRSVGRRLAANGFEVSAWCRSERDAQGIALYCGPDNLRSFLEPLEILVNLLPSTPQTAGIINADLLSHLQDGTSLINAGRGEQVIEDDLLAALRRGKISRAVLDVFSVEPLGAQSPFWTHPQVTITPHVAADALPVMQADYVARAIGDMEAGRTPPLLYDPALGY